MKMLGGRLLLRSLARVGQSSVRGNHNSFVSTPPMNYVPMWEKAAHGTFLTVAIFSYPFWVMYHLKDYRPLPTFKGIQQLIDDAE